MTAASTPAGNGPRPNLPVRNDGAEASAPTGLRGRISAFMAKHERLFWWGHSLYALALGSAVAWFAERQGFQQGRWLAVSLVIAAIVIIVLFKAFGSGQDRQVDETKLRDKLKYYAMTGVVKNSFQGMLFFLLPWYWKAATLDSPNVIFVIALGIVAILSTIDVFVDNVVMRFRAVAAVFYFFVMFAATNLVVPAMLPASRSLAGLLLAAALAAVVLFVMIVPLKHYGRPIAMAGLVLWVGAAIGGAFALRTIIPPVAMHVVDGGVSPRLLEDGRLALHARSIHVSLVPELHARTEVAAPGGKGDKLVHEWRQGNVLVHRDESVDSGAPNPEPGTVVLDSYLSPEVLPEDPVGNWTVDVLTEHGQLVGRVHFAVER